VKRVVSDTSPLISLEKVDEGYKFLKQLYDRVLIPPAVLRELADGPFESMEAYLSHFGIDDLFQTETPKRPRRDETEHLDPGEQEAVALAEEFDLPLLIEEEAGRVVARTLGIRISGIAGQLLRAVREEVIGTAQANRMLTELKKKGRINQRVFERVKQAIDEET
jgi:Predicted nucleic acid-binding protein, contains PIN domain